MTQSVAHAATLPASGSFRSPDDGGHPWPRGTTLPGDYVVERVLGQGGFAVVYEARHPEHGLVAVKVLDRSQKNNEATEDRFFREAKIAAAVDHPNVLKVHQLGRAHDGSPFLVMELLHGEDLSDLIDRQSLDVAAAIEIGIQLTAALRALSDAGVIHRDLKPHNVLVHDDGGNIRAKLIDFGIATSTEDSAVSSVEKLTRTGVILGTPHYLSPEQARGEDLDVRADLYALGVVLYESIAGRAPFEEGNLNALIASVLRDDRPRITEFVPDCPEDLADILAKTLERDKEARYQTPEEFLAALETFADEAELPRGQEALASLRVSKSMTLPWELRNLAPCKRDDRSIPVPIRMTQRGTPREVTRGSWDPNATVEWTDRDSDMTPRPIAVGTPPAEPSRRRFLAPLAAAAGVVIGIAVAGFAGAGDASPSEAHAAAPVVEHDEAVAESREASETAAEGTAAGNNGSNGAQADDTQAEAAEVAEAEAPAAEDEAETSEPAARRAPHPAPERPTLSAATLESQARQAYTRGRLSRARSLYLRATHVDASAAGAWRGYGLVAAQMGRDAEARRALTRYLQLAPRARDASAIRRRLASL